MKRADMHIHSTVSDGSCTIEQIIAMAKERELDGIVITDHDTLAQRNQIPNHEGLCVSWGVELSAWDYESGTRVHVLGYHIQKPEVVEQAALPILEARHRNSLRQIEVLQQHGYNIDVSKVKRANGTYIYKQHIMDYLVEQGMESDMFGAFYHQIFKNGGICAFDIQYMKAQTAVDVILQAGGLPVLAHSGQQQNFFLIPSLVEQGLKGLELNHHSHSENDRKTIRELALKHGLFLTGGSDFHGRYEPQIYEVGDFLAEESGIEAVFGF